MSLFSHHVAIFLSPQIEDQYDLKLEQECKDWISAILGEPFPEEPSFHEALKDGTILCRFVVEKEDFEQGIRKKKIGITIPVLCWIFRVLLISSVSGM